MANFLIAASIAWPMFLGAGWWSRTHHGPGWLTASTYLIAGRVCHQNPQRSFWATGAPLPVCGRCTALYLAAPIGALAALRRKKVPGVISSGNYARHLFLAALPTALTYGLEKLAGVPMTNVIRALAALPLGAVAAYYIVTVSRTRIN